MNYHDVDRLVARNFKIKVHLIHSSSHEKHIILARAAAIKINRDLLRLSFVKLSKIYNKRSHNTSSHSYKVANDSIDTDKDFRAKYTKALEEAMTFKATWKPRKQKYNLHYRLREKEIQVETKSRTISIRPDQEKLITGSSQLKKIIKSHNYQVQYSII